jgi:molybdopterin converting factor subunit 1
MVGRIGKENLVEKKESKLKVRLFASVRDLLGKDQVELEVTDKITASDLRKEINGLYPVLSTDNITFAIAVNRKLVDDTELVNPTDEIAILPPISGG